MSRTLLEAYERQRLADEMEAQRIEMRLKEFSQKPTREERIASMVQDGWSVAAARDDINTAVKGTGGWGAPGAFAETDTERRFKYGHLPAEGGRPSRRRPVHP